MADIIVVRVVASEDFGCPVNRIEQVAGQFDHIGCVICRVADVVINVISVRNPAKFLDDSDMFRTHGRFPQLRIPAGSVISDASDAILAFSSEISVFR